MIWKDIPGYSRYQASNTGLVRSKSTGKLQTIFPKASTKGTYLNCTTINDAGKRNCTTGVHVLVCLAFHGEQPENCRDVNHIDGDKHNNHESNVEWSTRSDNISHSYRNRERLDSQMVTVTDRFTGKSRTVHSMSELAKLFNLSHLKGDVLITDKPYLGRWEFTLVGTYEQPNRVDKQECFAINPVTNLIYACNSMTELAKVLCISKGAVSLAINNRKPINGFYISNEEKDLGGSFVDYDEALRSIEVYQNKSISSNKRNSSRLCVWVKQQGWVICDGWILLNAILVNNNLPVVSKDCRSDITRLIRDGGIYKGDGFKIMRAFSTKDCYPTDLPTLSIKDNRSGVTENMPNADVFAERFEISKDNVFNNDIFTVIPIYI